MTHQSYQTIETFFSLLVCMRSLRSSTLCSRLCTFVWVLQRTKLAVAVVFSLVFLFAALTDAEGIVHELRLCGQEDTIRDGLSDRKRAMKTGKCYVLIDRCCLLGTF